MTGPRHYREAERCISAVTTSNGVLLAGSDVPDVLALAQVHATLALDEWEAAMGGAS